MKRGLVFFLVFVFSFQFIGFSQAPRKFATSFGGNGVDMGYSLLELKQRFYVYVGSSSSYESQSSDILLSKIDSMGNLIWKKYYGGGGLDIGKKLVLNPKDSGYFIGGYSNSQVSSGYDGVCIRTDRFGNVIWQKHYGGLDWDFINDICLSASGDLYACGYTYSETNGYSDGFICKIDTANGNLKWQKTIGGPKSESLERIVSSSNGDIYAAGNKLNDKDINRFWLLRLKTNGDTISSKMYGHAYGSDHCYSLMEDQKQNLLLCGSFDTSIAASGKKNISYAIKTDLNGAVVSQFTLGYAGPNDRFLAVTCRKRTNDYFFSRSVLYGAQGTNVQPILFMDDFTYLSSTTYGGFDIEEAYGVIETSDNGFAMIGYTKSYTEAKDDNIYFIKLDSTLLNVAIVASLNEPVLSSKPTNLQVRGRVISIGQSGESFPYRIYSIDGQLLQSGTSQERKIILDSSLSSGIFIVRYYNEDWISSKFIITAGDE